MCYMQITHVQMLSAASLSRKSNLSLNYDDPYVLKTIQYLKFHVQLKHFEDKQKTEKTLVCFVYHFNLFVVPCAGFFFLKSLQ